MHKFIHHPVHVAGRLISDHLAKNSKADWAAHPILVAFETREAGLVKEVAAGKCDDIIL